MPARRTRPRTLAALIDYMDLFGGGFEVELRQALEKECERRGWQLLLIYGRMLSLPGDPFVAHNAVYDLLGPARADGLITLSSGLASRTGEPGLRRLFDKAGIRARASAGLAVQGTPSVVIDNRAGMEKLLEHVLEEHGCRRMAFIGGPAGNPDADARLETFERVLMRHGVTPDARWIERGDFVRRSGELAMAAILSRGPAPEAVIVANDGMALGALSALSRHGLRVPDDVIVTGFDDLAMARLGEPPLTTVAQPLRAMLSRALEMIDAELEGRAVEPIVSLPAELVIRDSCGCRSIPRREPVPAHTATLAEAHDFIVRQREHIVSALHAPEYGRRTLSEASVRRLLSALLQELAGESRSFGPAIKAMLGEIGGDHERRQELLSALFCLRDELRPVSSTRVEDLFHDATAEVALTDARIQVQQRLEIDQAYSLLMEKGEEFSNALDLPALAEGLCRSLPALGMNTAFISIHPPHDSTRLLPLVCLVDGKPLTTPAAAFPSSELIPPGVLADEPAKGRTLLVLPLVLKARCLGVCVFQHDPSINGYVVVRDRISVALGGIELHQAILESTTLHARKIQEQQRLANEDRIRSLNVLAGGVAHDLNNSLGPLVALPDVMLRELDHLEQRAGGANATLRSDLESIKSSGMRAAQTIKDLLALSRQSRTGKDVFDLNPWLTQMIADPSRGPARLGVHVTLKLELAPNPLWILASEPHLSRVFANLALNAADAMDHRGTLVVRTSERSLGAEEARRENVREGRYGVLEVSDTGKGISPEEVTRIFEPFFSSKPPSETSGSGLGLAIVESIVKDHGGFVTVHSIVGRGTTFTLHFPLEGSAPKQRENQRLSLGGSGKILVVDDDPIQLRTAVRLLEHFGYAVTAVSSGVEAYGHFSRTAQAANSPYDLVILDMLLNEAEDGLELYRRIQRSFPQQKAIVISGHAPPERAELAIAEGLSWLPKPYTAAALAAAVRGALASYNGSSRS